MIFKAYVVGNMYCIDTPRRKISEQEFCYWLQANNPAALETYQRRHQEKTVISEEMAGSEPEAYWKLDWDDPCSEALISEHRTWKKRLNRKLKAVNRRHKYSEGFDLTSAWREAEQEYGQADAELLGTIEVELDRRYVWDEARYENVRRFLNVQMNVGQSSLQDRQFVKAGTGCRIKRIDIPMDRMAVNSD
jgi:hypothetical protein